MMRRESAQPSFFDVEQPMLDRLFDAVDMINPQDPKLIVEQTQPWAHGDHGRLAHRIDLDATQKQELSTVFDHFGMLGERLPEQQVYQQAVILGGLALSNIERTAFLYDHLRDGSVQLEAGAPIVFWGGPRLPLDREHADLRMMLDQANYAKDQPWLIRQHNQQRDPALVDEAAQGALVLQRTFGDLHLKEVDIRHGYEQAPGVVDPSMPPGAMSHYVFESAALPDNDLIVLNGLAVSRQSLSGANRHTTRSCAEDAFSAHSRHAAQTGDAVAFVTSNPYIPRTVSDVQMIQADLGSQAHIYGCGPGPAAHADERLMLGELARRLYVEQQRLARV
jgi:hypothetical protein